MSRYRSFFILSFPCWRVLSRWALSDMVVCVGGQCGDLRCQRDVQASCLMRHPCLVSVHQLNRCQCGTPKCLALGDSCQLHVWGPPSCWLLGTLGPCVAPAEERAAGKSQAVPSCLSASGSVSGSGLILSGTPFPLATEPLLPGSFGPWACGPPTLRVLQAVEVVLSPGLPPCPRMAAQPCGHLCRGLHCTCFVCTCPWRGLAPESASPFLELDKVSCSCRDLLESTCHPYSSTRDTSIFFLVNYSACH